MTHVIVFGDSVSYGLFDPAGGWVQRIRAAVDGRNAAEDGYWTLVYNLGISGDTAADLLQRIETELPARKESDATEDNIVLFALGINDSAYLVREQRPRFTDQEFRSNLQSLVTVAKKHSSKIGFLGLFPVYQPAVDPIPWAPEMAYRNTFIKNFDLIIRNLCEMENLDYVDMSSVWTDDDARLYLQDGVHPNARGHERLAEKALGLFRNYKVV